MGWDKSKSAREASGGEMSLETRGVVREAGASSDGERGQSPKWCGGWRR